MTSLCRLFYCIKKYVLKTVELHINAKAWQNILDIADRNYTTNSKQHISRPARKEAFTSRQVEIQTYKCCRRQVEETSTTSLHDSNDSYQIWAYCTKLNKPVHRFEDFLESYGTHNSRPPPSPLPPPLRLWNVLQATTHAIASRSQPGQDSEISSSIASATNATPS